MREDVDYVDPATPDEALIAQRELAIMTGQVPPEYHPGAHCPVSFDSLHQGDDDAKLVV